MTLEEMLALLADNATGAISAADMRAIVTQLYTDTAAVGALTTGLNAEMAIVQSQLLGLQGSVTALEGNVTTLQGNVSTLQGSVATLQGNVTTLQGSVTTLEGSVTTLQGQVTSLENHDSYAQVFSYLWTNTAGPAVGKVTADAWSMAATKIQINETTDDGQALTFQLLDNATNRQIRLLTADGKRMRATMNGVSVDNGAYRDLFVTVNEVVGAAPTLNQRTSVAIILEMVT